MSTETTCIVYSRLSRRYRPKRVASAHDDTEHDSVDYGNSALNVFRTLWF